MHFYIVFYPVVERPMKGLIDFLHYSFSCSNVYIQEQPPSKHTSTSNMKLTLTTLTYLSLGIYVALTFECLHWNEQLDQYV